MTRNNPDLSVAAIIVTRNRWTILRDTLDGVLKQSRPPDEIFIVDNDSVESPPCWVDEAGSVKLIRTSNNGGYAYGLAKGIEAAQQNGHTHYWLMDDDSRPEQNALEALLRALRTCSHNVGILGQRGGLIRYGNVRHFKESIEIQQCLEILPGVRLVEFTLVDGALLSDIAVQTAGLPDPGMFMMFEDIEYSWRIGKAGFEVAIIEQDLAHHLHLGSQSDRKANLWRQYYMARNQVYWAVYGGQLMNVVGTTWRLLKLLIGALVHARWYGASAIVIGVRDGLQRKRGLTVAPGEVPRWRTR